jgi:uncharacterized protein
VTAVLMVPGLSNSGPDHWQTLWEAREPSWRRIQQADWETPLLDDWVFMIAAAVASARVPVALVAHSLGCIALAHWASIGASIRGALLVAPTDVEADSRPVGPRGFVGVPFQRLPFPSIVVASSDDPYVSLERARLFAEAWGSTFVNVGSRGHINAASGLGDWPEGRTLLDQLLKSAE